MCKPQTKLVSKESNSMFVHTDILNIYYIVWKKRKFTMTQEMSRECNYQYDLLVKTIIF